MNKEIKVIKRAVRNVRQAERQQVLLPARNKTELASPLQLTKTIQEWVRIHRQTASKELSTARSLMSSFS